MLPVLVSQIVLVLVAFGGWLAGKGVHALFIRKSEDSERYTAELPRMGETIAFISGAVGILLGLLLSMSVSNFQDAQASVKEYGSSVAAAYRTTEGFSEPGRTTVRQDLFCAVDTFVSYDWTSGMSAQAQGNSQANLWMTQLNLDVNALSLDDPVQNQAWPILMQSTLDMSHWRQLILLTSSETIPKVIWVVIYVSVFVLALLLTLHLADRRGLSRLSFGVAYITLAVIIFALSVLDYPLHNFGAGPAVSPQSLIDMLQADDFDFTDSLTSQCPQLDASDYSSPQ